MPYLVIYFKYMKNSLHRHATPRHAIRHATPRHATPHHTTPHQTTPHHTTPHENNGMADSTTYTKSAKLYIRTTWFFFSKATKCSSCRIFSPIQLFKLFRADVFITKTFVYAFQYVTFIYYYNYRADNKKINHHSCSLVTFCIFLYQGHSFYVINWPQHKSG